MTRVNWHKRINDSEDHEWQDAMRDVLDDWQDDADFLIDLAKNVLINQPEAYSDLDEPMTIFSNERTQLQASLAVVGDGCDEALQHAIDPMSREIIRKVLGVLNKADYMLEVALNPNMSVKKEIKKLRDRQTKRAERILRERRGDSS